MAVVGRALTVGLFKRGNVWWLRYREPDGRMVRRSTKQTNKQKAEGVWADVVSSIRTGAYVPQHRRRSAVEIPPLELALNDYLADREQRGKRPDSYRKLDTDWRAAFAGVEIPDITLDAVESRLAAWKAERRWSPATYNNALGQLSGFLSWCYRKGWVERHPLKGRAERMDVNNARERYFYPHEMAAMQRTALAVARWKQHERRTWLRDIIVAAAYTGLRRGVFCNLRCRDVRRDENGELWLRVARDKNGRPVERRLLGETLAVVERRLGDALPAAHLFPGPDGVGAYTAIERWLPVVVNRIGKRNPDWGLRWGVKGGGVTFHSFRHAMASLALNSGTDRDVVKRLGNWRTDVMVNRYAHRADQHIRDAEERLAEVLAFDKEHTRSTPDRPQRSRRIKRAVF